MEYDLNFIRSHRAKPRTCDSLQDMLRVNDLLWNSDLIHVDEIAETLRRFQAQGIELPAGVRLEEAQPAPAGLRQIGPLPVYAEAAA